ncbi:hypothetical protein F5884DRAFT_818635 [Xylogone sp. PMI_703]|nr:hypothetical protein F5884DRAFT_818635 [Xylogone sp. PMI_703]
MTDSPQNKCEIEGQQCQLPPFSIRLLRRVNGHSIEAYGQHLSLLPASYRTDADDLAVPGHDIPTVMICVKKELDLCRLAQVHSWLWVAGRPVPPRPLHYQLLIGRGIFITEQMDMHLVWTTGQIYLKPIPRFLLEPNFWIEYLSCKPECGPECECRGLRERALGFLFSYAALISHESDFHVTVEKQLIPSEVGWLAWRRFVEELDTEHIYQNIDPRFYYGELRLGQLNKIYYLFIFFQDSFTWLVGTTAYIAVALTAMQVGLATEPLTHNDVFQSASYGFTVFSILGPLIAACFIILAFCGIFFYNWVVTIKYRKKRFQHIGHGIHR